ncbi:MAG: phospho-N-acetylmuramoyl-pentapeptide-transferase [Candidatus Omnitrophica bacterium]|nr:phospho-N-acetylmuramoyl-pentapeptide-transferase [Candidatus Omnitrophota bacterium]
MLYHLLYPLKDLWFGFNVFRYITFRAALAGFTSFIICLIFGPLLIKWLRELRAAQYVRKEHVDGLRDFNSAKEGTPTMGGVLMIVAVLISSLLWCLLDNDYVLLCLGGMIWLGIIGFVDDCIKIRNRNATGIRGITKLAGQMILALIVGLFVAADGSIGTGLYLPFIKNAVANLGMLYIIFVLLVIVGASNALNLTDGLDGLATGCVIFITLTLAIMSYITGHVDISGYLNVFYLPGAGEVTVFCSALMGAGLGFLWYNSYPASVFMGDTGSLSLGGTVAIVSVLIKKEFLLFLVGGVLVAEALSVIIQVFSFKVFGRRVFLMSPLHHHFQLKNLHESKITVRFWIVAAILVMLSMATLKVR